MAKRILAALLVVVMLASMAACAVDPTEPVTSDTSAPTDTTPKDTTPEDTTSEDTTPEDTTPENPTPEDPTPEEPETFNVDLVKEGSPKFIVVSKSPAYDDMAATVAELLSAKTGVGFSSRISTKDPSSGTKIYVGESPDKLMDDSSVLTYSGYLILYSGGHIYISGFSKDAILAGATKFVENIKEEYITTVGGQINVTVPHTLFGLVNPESYPIANATLLGNKLSQYTVVVPENYNVNEKFMLNDILDQIGLQTGYRLKFIKDSSSAVTEYEIVLGKTTRAGSATLYGALADESYAIKSIDNRVYVAYDNYLVATDAAAKLIALLSEAPTSVDVTETPDYAKELVKKKAGADIRVMTTNIVAAGDTESQKYLGEKYGITWEERVEIQAQMILTFLPDFVGMQEMQEGTTNGVRAQMHGVMKKAVAGEYTFVTYDGLLSKDYWTPIMYRSTVWQLEAKDYTPDFGDGSMHRLQWALFSKIDDPSVKYIIINLHYPTSKNAALQTKAAGELNELFKSLKEQYPTVPISVTGDYNTAYGSAVYNASVADTDLKTSFLATRDKSQAQAPIDHILVEDDDVTVFAYRVVDNGHIYKTSDHRPVFADIAYGKIIIPTPGPDVPWEEGEPQ